MKCTNEAGTKVLLITFYITKQKNGTRFLSFFRIKRGCHSVSYPTQKDVRNYALLI